MTNVSDLVKKYQDKIRQANLDESVVYLFIEHLTGYYKTELMLVNDLKVDEKLLEVYVDSYCSGISAQYIINSAYFLGRKFYVDSNVLIPRFETEEVVLKAIEIIKENSIKSVCDVGCGSGVIAITLKLDCGIDVYATDISEEALRVAKKNSEMLKADVNYLHTNLLAGVEKSIEMIVSNPPYIPTKGYVAKETLDNEPHLALFGGDDGLDFYRNIIEGAKQFSNLKYIVFEIGFDQGEAIKKLSENVEIFDDINGNNRIVVITLGR